MSKEQNDRGFTEEELKKIIAEEEEIKALIVEEPCDTDANVFERDAKQQTDWFEYLRKRVVSEIDAQTFEPRLYLLVRDPFTRHEAVERGGDASKMFTVSIADYVDRRKPIYTFREFFARLKERYHIFASVVAAPAWTPARENGIDKRSQVIFIGESINRRDFIMLDVAEENKKKAVSSSKVMNAFDGEAQDRFSGMVYMDYSLGRGWVIVQEKEGEESYASLVVFPSQEAAEACKTLEEQVREVRPGELMEIKRLSQKRRKEQLKQEQEAFEEAQKKEEASKSA